MKFKTYLVGGAVRDAFLGLPSKDHDYVVSAPSFEAMKQDLLADGCKIFVEKPEYLTIRAKHPVLGCVDFAVIRKDGNYTDGRRPDSTEVAQTLEQDLARRDFTCNAIAKDVEDGSIFDPFDGCIDITQRVLRSVGNPNDRLAEDKLRAFRALRFAVTKHFFLSTELRIAIGEFVLPSDFDGVSTERIREEIYKMFRKDVTFSCHLLINEFPVLWQVILSRGIWLKPTTEE